jgi:hypothetical protein
MVSDATANQRADLLLMLLADDAAVQERNRQGQG